MTIRIEAQGNGVRRFGYLTDVHVGEVSKTYLTLTSHLDLESRTGPAGVGKSTPLAAVSSYMYVLYFPCTPSNTQYPRSQTRMICDRQQA